MHGRGLHYQTNNGEEERTGERKEKRREENLPLFLFLDCEKAYDKVKSSKLCSILGRYKVPVNVLNGIKALYNNTSFTIKMGNTFCCQSKATTGLWTLPTAVRSVYKCSTGRMENIETEKNIPGQ
jgi:hypothetical protein